MYLTLVKNGAKQRAVMKIDQLKRLFFLGAFLSSLPIWGSSIDRAAHNNEIPFISCIENEEDEFSDDPDLYDGTVLQRCIKEKGRWLFHEQNNWQKVELQLSTFSSTMKQSFLVWNEKLCSLNALYRVIRSDEVGACPSICLSYLNTLSEFIRRGLVTNDSLFHFLLDQVEFGVKKMSILERILHNWKDFTSAEILVENKGKYFWEVADKTREDKVLKAFSGLMEAICGNDKIRGELLEALLKVDIRASGPVWLLLLINYKATLLRLRSSNSWKDDFLDFQITSPNRQKISLRELIGLSPNKEDMVFAKTNPEKS